MGFGWCGPVERIITTCRKAKGTLNLAQTPRVVLAGEGVIIIRPNAPNTHRSVKLIFSTSIHYQYDLIISITKAQVDRINDYKTLVISEIFPFKLLMLRQYGKILNSWVKR